MKESTKGITREIMMFSSSDFSQWWPMPRLPLALNAMSVPNCGKCQLSFLKSAIQLSLDQHWFELPRSACMWIFFFLNIVQYYDSIFSSL